MEQQRLWSFKTGEPRKQSLYRICDPYMRFYLKVIEPRRNQIDLGAFDDTGLAFLPGWEAHQGLQLELLLLQNRQLLLKALGVDAREVVCDGPYRQGATVSAAGCQIDYLVQTRSRNLLVCEIKGSRREVGVEVLEAVEEKVAALKVPRGFAVLPALFH